jgi:hypothetical protein
MINVNKEVYTELQAINENIKVFPENFINSSTILPCITYLEYSNLDTLTGDSMEYSEVIILVKVWSKDYNELMVNALLIDAKMKPIGYDREFGSILFNDGVGQYILRYKGLGFNTK